MNSGEEEKNHELLHNRFCASSQRRFLFLSGIKEGGLGWGGGMEDYRLKAGFDDLSTIYGVTLYIEIHMIVFFGFFFPV